MTGRWIFPKHGFLPHTILPHCIRSKCLCPALQCSIICTQCNYLGLVLITYLTLQAGWHPYVPHKCQAQAHLGDTAQDDLLCAMLFLPPSPFQPGEGRHWSVLAQQVCIVVNITQFSTQWVLAYSKCPVFSPQLGCSLPWEQSLSLCLATSANLGSQGSFGISVFALIYTMFFSNRAWEIQQQFLNKFSHNLFSNSFLIIKLYILRRNYNLGLSFSLLTNINITTNYSGYIPIFFFIRVFNGPKNKQKGISTSREPPHVGHRTSCFILFKPHNCTETRTKAFFPLKIDFYLKIMLKNSTWIWSWIHFKV